ncbi:MAG: hypothetical protein ACRED1_03690 [Limisphaerales bacterium]
MELKHGMAHEGLNEELLEKYGGYRPMETSPMFGPGQFRRDQVERGVIFWPGWISQ